MTHLRVGVDSDIWPYRRSAPPVYMNLRPVLRPRVFVTSWGFSAHQGHRRRWSIAPPWFGDLHPDADGWAEFLVPGRDTPRDGSDFLAEHARRLWARSDNGRRLRPDQMLALCGRPLPSGAQLVGGDRPHCRIKDGDTLCCVCSPVDAREGRCWRLVLAHALTEAGYEVVLDGAPVGHMAERPTVRRRERARAPATTQARRGRSRRREMPREDRQLGLDLGRG